MPNQPSILVMKLAILNLYFKECFYLPIFRIKIMILAKDIFKMISYYFLGKLLIRKVGSKRTFIAAVIVTIGYLNFKAITTDAVAAVIGVINFKVR